jgi:hypothetical protein
MARYLFIFHIGKPDGEQDLATHFVRILVNRFVITGYLLSHVRQDRFFVHIFGDNQFCDSRSAKAKLTVKDLTRLTAEFRLHVTLLCRPQTQKDTCFWYYVVRTDRQHYYRHNYRF